VTIIFGYKARSRDLRSAVNTSVWGLEEPRHLATSTWFTKDEGGTAVTGEQDMSVIRALRIGVDADRAGLEHCCPPIAGRDFGVGCASLAISVFCTHECISIGAFAKCFRVLS